MGEKSNYLHVVSDSRTPEEVIKESVEAMSQIKQDIVKLFSGASPSVKYNVQRGIDRLDEFYFWLTSAVQLASMTGDKGAEEAAEKAVKEGNLTIVGA